MTESQYGDRRVHIDGACQVCRTTVCTCVPDPALRLRSEPELEPARLALADVLDPRYVDVHGAAAIAGIAKQTLHNLQTMGRVDFKPVGQLRYIGRAPMIYRRSDVEEWAAQRG